MVRLQSSADTEWSVVSGKLTTLQKAVLPTLRLAPLPTLCLPLAVNNRVASSPLRTTQNFLSVQYSPGVRVFDPLGVVGTIRLADFIQDIFSSDRGYITSGFVGLSS